MELSKRQLKALQEQTDSKYVKRRLSVVQRRMNKYWEADEKAGIKHIQQIVKETV